MRARMQSLGCPLSVHVYNALIAVCEHENQWDQVDPLVSPAAALSNPAVRTAAHC